ncbi:MAG: hypothetical protein FGM41_01500, partial [Bacteroidetes bacterium]|nr:hypothetical protein [Bacteroidota bacterium]
MTNTNFTGNVTIEPLTTVIIPKGVVIKLKSQKSIEIKPSAKLVVNGVIDYDDSDPTIPLFERKFNGIFVRGISTIKSPGIQSVLNGGYPWGNPNSNGALMVDGGEINNGFSSIMSFNGGIIYINNSIISGYRNNGLIFKHDIPFNIKSIPTLVIVKNSTFVNSQYLDTYIDVPVIAISASGFHGISVSNCEFYNGITNPDAFSSGIALTQIGISITNCTFESYKDNKIAIFSQSFLGSVRGYINISNCEFNDCGTGILLRGIELAKIKNNNFIPQNAGVSTGIKIFRSTGFDIKGNTFRDYGNSSIGNAHLSDATQIDGSG